MNERKKRKGEREKERERGREGRREGEMNEERRKEGNFQITDFSSVERMSYHPQEVSEFII